MAKLYANENFPQQVVQNLRDLGHDVLTTLDSGRAGQAVPDDDVLAFASETNRILITFNRRDFIKLHRQDSNHAGIIVCTVDPDFEALSERIHAAPTQGDNLNKQLIRINRPNP